MLGPQIAHLYFIMLHKSLEGGEKPGTFPQFFEKKKCETFGQFLERTLRRPPPDGRPRSNVCRVTLVSCNTSCCDHTHTLKDRIFLTRMCVNGKPNGGKGLQTSYTFSVDFGVSCLSHSWTAACHAACYKFGMTKEGNVG